MARGLIFLYQELAAGIVPTREIPIGWMVMSSVTTQLSSSNHRLSKLMPLGHVGVIGGGINGLCIAWELAKRGWAVDLFERGRCLQQTSSASTKLLHGGLRYLEQGHLALVAESLRERARWLSDAPEHAHWLPLLLPIYC